MHRFASGLAVALALAASAPASAQRYVEVARAPAGVVSGTGPTFGASVALDGTTAVIGAPEANGGAGAVHVYDVSGGTPALLASLTATGALGLGTAVAVRGSLIVAGAPRTPIESRADVGVVVVYQRSGTAVTQLQRFGPGDSDADGGALFGQALAFAGPASVVVGAPGIRTAFLVSAVSTGPMEAGSASDPAVPGYAGALAVGTLEGGTVIAVIGSGDRAAVADVDLWTLGPSGGVVAGSIENGAGLASFGSALAVDGPRVAVGIPGRDEVKIYLVDAAGAATAIEAYDGPPASGFGTSVALHGDLAFGGAPAAGALFGDVGEAYVLRSDTLFPRRPAIRTTRPFVQGLGASMARSGSLLLVGAPGSSGHAILFGDGTALPCTLASDCPATEACIDGVCCQSACGDDPADCQTCASDRARGWCVLAEVGTGCSSAAGTCTGTCSGESAVCEMLECVDAGGLDAGTDDAAVASLDAAAAPDAAESSDAAPTGISFGGGGGCRCAAIGAVGPASPLLGLALLALATSIARRRRARTG